MSFRVALIEHLSLQDYMKNCEGLATIQPRRGFPQYSEIGHDRKQQSAYTRQSFRDLTEPGSFLRELIRRRRRVWARKKAGMRGNEHMYMNIVCFCDFLLRVALSHDIPSRLCLMK